MAKTANVTLCITCTVFCRLSKQLTVHCQTANSLYAEDKDGAGNAKGYAFY